VTLVWLPKRAPQPHVLSRVLDERPVENAPFRAALSDRLVMALTANMALVSMAFGSSYSFLGLRLEDDLKASPALIGLAFSTQDITGGLAQPLFGRLADRYNRRILVAIGLASLGTMLMLLSTETVYGLVVLTLFAMGASNGLSQVSSSAIQVVAGRRVGMGTMLGLSSAGNGLGILVGSVLGGVLVDLVSIPAAFVFSGIAICCGAPLFLALTQGLPTNEVEYAEPRPSGADLLREGVLEPDDSALTSNPSPTGMGEGRRFEYDDTA
jgi:MFS family permease